MDTQSKTLETINSDVQLLRATLKQAAQTIITEEVSLFPIFIVHQEPVQLGIPLVDKNTFGSHWYYSASTLEDLMSKGVIVKEKLDSFKSVYKNPTEQACLFVVQEEGAKIIFVPY